MIYFDNSATTAVLPEAAEAAKKYMCDMYYNPAAAYSPAVAVERDVNAARTRLASCLNADASELIFTSGGTESNNMALAGTLAAKHGKCRLITSAVEHPSVFEPVTAMKQQGYDVVVIGVDGTGKLRMDELAAALDETVGYVSIMHVNNESGAINDISRINALIKKQSPDAVFHVDGVQAFVKMPAVKCDMYSMSGHKLHAPKGIGALYLSDRLVQAFRPPYLGGEQERGLRPGTENLPYAMGLAAAATRLAKTMKSRDTAMRALNQRLREGLKAFPEVEINSPENAVPEVLNFSENCIKSETMLAFLAEEQIYVSSASACGRGQPSHTLAAMGRSPLAIDTAIRVSFCADNTPEDVDAFLNRFEDGMKHLQRIKR